ncbi:hypothetical protein MEQU1_003214 [Malassezia equina]|uniref:BZIP domain-containing protein n=1 Tax=Malassezia equina TaxID=1381935 RepID=A0AAF0ELU0_9BASI|nr:hypothetical protein MEQU1_003214 [Malassezia equina]
MRRPEPARARTDEEDGSSSPSALPDDEEDLRSDFLADFDEQAFLAQLDLLNAKGAPAPPGDTVAPITEAPRTVTPSALGTYAPPSSDFYSTAIQILTHILGSSTPYPWLAEGSTPRADDGGAAPPWDMASSPHPVSSSQVDLPQLINTLVERLGGPTPPRRVREQDLTHLLQTLLAQQGPPTMLPPDPPTSARNVPAAAATPAAPPATATTRPVPQPLAPPQPLHFADLTFPEEEEDDPDFLPLSHESDELTAPSASAWSRAMEEMVPARTKKHDASSTSLTKPKRGRPRQFTAEEAMARKRGRNRDYMARQREKKQGEAPSLAPPPVHAAPSAPEDRLVLEAENRFLRTELERLREENARLRGREEMPRLGLDRRTHEA